MIPGLSMDLSFFPFFYCPSFLCPPFSNYFLPWSAFLLFIVCPRSLPCLPSFPSWFALLFSIRLSSQTSLGLCLSQTSATLARLLPTFSLKVCASFVAFFVEDKTSREKFDKTKWWVSKCRRSRRVMANRQSPSSSRLSTSWSTRMRRDPDL